MNLNEQDKERLIEALRYFKNKDIIFDEEIDEINESESEPNRHIDFLIVQLLGKDESLNECQIGSTVFLNKEKGSVIGQTSDGDIIVQVQGSTHKVNPKKVEFEKQELVKAKPQFKFDKKTQKLLFEQYIKCGVYYNNVPLKTTNCYVKFNDYNDANDEQPINVLIEGRSNLMSKSRIRLFEDVNDFANRDSYVEGVIIDEETKEAKENVLINALDYTNAIGDADMVRVIIDRNGEQEMQSLPAATLKTLSI